MSSFTTSITLPDEQDADIRVEYSFYAGYKGSQIEPPEPASVEIINITPADPLILIPNDLYEDDDLLAECMAHHCDMLTDAAERRAEDRREALYLDRFA